jgi:hypothetical protein
LRVLYVLPPCKHCFVFLRPYWVTLAIFGRGCFGQTENTSLGTGALQNKATGTLNTAIGITMSLQF